MQNFTYSNINENKKWIDEAMNLFNSKKPLQIENYPNLFKKIKKILRHGDFHDKYKGLVVCERILQYYFKNQSTEFDFINAFNTVIEDLILYLGENVFKIK